ncbi:MULTISPECIES: biotin--[acetyl-CoA-carboxylase] ligase [unclassified Ruminococcus]|uniref:biotin--[acetyl-CoA-carboxylase] ligase n=1 Tax=unclassified Ruminococcus TaxID=2608920 RepID=UPI00210D19B6|nr:MULTISPECIES: biotin--[acetyl-CoA-carboxylase] ligase [unclassified Ruminococcus]
MSTVNSILEFLRRDGYISGQEISDSLGISRNSISKHIKALRQKGYVIDSVTNRGYKLLSEPDELLQQDINNKITTLFIGRPTVILDSVDSTNEEIKRRAKQGAKQGLTVVSDEQFSGKGRLGRVWKSPKGTSVYESILLRPELAPSQVPCITLAAGLAMCRTINSIADFNAKIKWPNDIIIGRKKLCGILTEMAIEDNTVSFAVVGMGININNRSFPEEISKKATSLYLEKEREFSRSDIIIRLAQSFEDIYNEFIMGGFESIKDEYISLCATIGRSVSAKRNDGEISGTAVDIAPDGGLIVETQNGEKKYISTGEVAVQGIY